MASSSGRIFWADFKDDRTPRFDYYSGPRCSNFRTMRKPLTSAEHTLLSRVLRTARLEAGLTQAEIARRIKRPQSFVANYENGKQRIYIEDFIDLANALATDPAALLKLFVEETNR